jgi:hypothetical protein
MKKKTLELDLQNGIVWSILIKSFPKRKEKGEKKKNGYENNNKIFLHPKEKDIENKHRNIFFAI